MPTKSAQSKKSVPAKPAAAGRSTSKPRTEGRKAESRRASAKAPAAPAKLGKAPAKTGTTGATGTPGTKDPQVDNRPPLRVRHAPAPLSVRPTNGFDDGDVLPLGGGGHGNGFGRCGGRVLGSRLEQILCDRLSNAGVTHSHTPRHFEVRFGEKSVAAYAPMIVLRGRGREGKTVVIECCEQVDSPNLTKIEAFRRQYGLEFYVIFVAPEEVIDDVTPLVYDESCASSEIGTLINRLAD